MSNEEKRAKVHEILDLVMDINGLEARMSGENSGPTVFFEFIGHIGSIQVQIYNNGWNGDSERDLSLEHSFRHNHYQSLEEVEQQLKECAQCGQGCVKEDLLETATGDICEDCLEEM